MPRNLLTHSPSRLGLLLALAGFGLLGVLQIFEVLDAPAGAAPTTATAGPRFGQTVAAIFNERCVRCHGADESNGGLRLDGYAAVMRGGERGRAVVPGNASASLLLQKVLRRDRPPMPPKKILPGGEVGQIRAWIDAGALP